MKSTHKKPRFFLTFLSFTALAMWEIGLFAPSQTATAQITPATDGPHTPITPRHPHPHPPHPNFPPPPTARILKLLPAATNSTSKADNNPATVRISFTVS